VKKGDLLDGMLAFQRKAGQLDLADWPEDVAPLLQRMFSLWGVVPPKRSTAQGGQWIKEARSVISNCAEFGLPLLDDVCAEGNALPNGQRFIPARPISLIGWVVKAAAKRRGPGGAAQAPGVAVDPYTAWGERIRPPDKSRGERWAFDPSGRPIGLTDDSGLVWLRDAFGQKIPVDPAGNRVISDV
jgi:hypothetical protein